MNKGVTRKLCFLNHIAVCWNKYGFVNGGKNMNRNICFRKRTEGIESLINEKWKKSEVKRL